MAEIDWLKATKEQRARLYQVAKAVMDMHSLSPDDFYKASLGHVVDAASTNGNFARGLIGRQKAALIHGWISENYFDIGLRLAPDLFERPARGSWLQLLNSRAQYGALSILRLLNMGVVQFADKHPIDGRPLRLGAPFAFLLRSRLKGFVFALQELGGDWHVIPLGEGDESYLVPCTVGEQALPSDRNGKPIPLVEIESDGLQSFVFVVLGETLDIESTLKELSGLALRSEQLDHLAGILEAADRNSLEIHRINVVFVR